MNDSPSLAQALVERTRRMVWLQRLAGTGLVVLLIAEAALLILLFADAAFALPEGLRAAALPGLAAGIALAGLALATLHHRLKPDEMTAARLTEQALGCRDRELVAALQLSRMPGDLAMAGHHHLIGRLEPAAITAPRLRVGRSPHQWWQAMVAVALVGVGIHVAQPTLFPAVWPRFADPAGDHPPFSRTRVDWESLPGRVREGDAARGMVTVQGAATDVVLCGIPMAAKVRHWGDNLLTASGQHDAPIIRVPMFSLGAGRFAGEIAACRTPLVVWVEAGGTRTRYRRLGIDPVPVFTHMDVRIEAPAYARLAPESRRVKPGSPGESALLPGSRLRLVPAANRALAALWVVRNDLLRNRLALVDGAAVIDDPVPGAYAFAAEAVDGVRGEPVPLLRLSERPDGPPRLEIIAPGRDAVATPGMRVPLVIAASDDLGLARIHRVQSWNGLPAPELLESCSGVSHRTETALDLPTLGVATGEVITIAAMARDTRPGGGQVSPLAQRTIRIMGEEEYNQLLRRRLKPDALIAKYRPQLQRLKELEQAMRELRDKMQAMDKEELAKALKELARKARELAKDVQAMRRPDPLWKLEPALQEALRQAAEELARKAENGELASGQLQAAAMLQEDLELMVAMARAKGLVARLRQLIDAEQNTAERLEPLAEHRRLNDTDRVQLRELGGQEQELATAIEQWLGLAPTVAENLRRDPRGGKPAQELDGLAQALKASGAADLKKQAALAARQGDGGEARRLAAEARDRLLKLLGQAGRCSGSCDGLGLSLAWGDGRGFGMGMNNGYGMGGAGAAGMGFALGYGGDDQGGSMPSDAMDLYGPEAFGDSGLANQDERAGDGVATMAAAGAGAARQAAGYQRTVRGGAAATRSNLSPAERATVDEYRRRLENER